MLNLPEGFFIQNYIDAWTRGNLGRYYINSVIATSATLVVILILGSMIGFAIEKMIWKFSAITLKIFLSGIMIPGIMLLLPQFFIIRQLDLYNTLLSVILIYSSSQLPLAIFLFATFFRFLPNDIIESSVIDGCSIPRSFFTIVLPLSVNTVVTIIILTFFVVWNDFVVANTFIASMDLKTLQIGISFFTSDWNHTEWGPIFAGLSIGTIPTIFLYLALNKKVLAGVAEGSVKG